jgi:hypothetical protein
VSDWVTGWAKALDLETALVSAWVWGSASVLAQVQASGMATDQASGSGLAPELVQELVQELVMALALASEQAPDLASAERLATARASG